MDEEGECDASSNNEQEEKIHPKPTSGTYLHSLQSYSDKVRPGGVLFFQIQPKKNIIFISV